MAAKKEKTSTKEDVLELVSFKLSKAYHDLLVEYAESQTEDDGTGRKLSPSLAARRLLVEVLKKKFPKS